MTHYTVEFKGNAETKHVAAIAECMRWMGARKFNIWCKRVREAMTGSRTEKLRGLYFAAGMMGMQGRAVVHALYRHIFVRM